MSLDGDIARAEDEEAAFWAERWDRAEKAEETIKERERVQWLEQENLRLREENESLKGTVARLQEQIRQLTPNEEA